MGRLAQTLGVSVSLHRSHHMTEYKYEHGLVPPAVEHIFTSLVKEFASSYEIWVRAENLGRWVTAAVLNPQTKVAVMIAVADSRKVRGTHLSDAEVKAIRTHLESNLDKDLSI